MQRALFEEQLAMRLDEEKRDAPAPKNWPPGDTCSACGAVIWTGVDRNGEPVPHLDANGRRLPCREIGGEG
jgi:hypothetical protein